MQPHIGITTNFDPDLDRLTLTRYYVDSVEEAGGIPLLLPLAGKQETWDRYVEVLDGLLLSGGVDVDPGHFGEEPLPGLGEITPERDIFEIALAQQFMQAGKPILAICRGIQLLNIAAGGDIYQDITTQLPGTLKHMQQAPRWYATHTVTIQGEGKLADIFHCSQIRVNSFHHQAVRLVADGFCVTARSLDGLVEAIEMTASRFTVGVQWHPECMWQRDRKHLALFLKFIEHCSQ